MWLLINMRQWGWGAVCIKYTVLTALGVPGLALHRIIKFYISVEKMLPNWDFFRTFYGIRIYR